MVAGSKQAACLNCRRSKIKCKRAPGASACERCQTSTSDCVVPSFHIGRQKGVKNKRTGLEKAIFQIEEAIKKSKSETFSHEGILEQLQQLLDEARGGSLHSATPTSSRYEANVPDRDVEGQSSDEQLALDDVENPLQLLARASDLRHAGRLSIGQHAQSPPDLVSDRNDPDVSQFFRPISARLDVGPDLDPIKVGLLGLEEADVLVSFFYTHLSHTRWGLDPALHALEFIRDQSSFLFTSVLLAASRFHPDTAALSTRLLIHRKFLLSQIISRRYRSVEIVIALLINIPWMHPLENAADDDTGLFIGMGISMGIDLSLNKIISTSGTYNKNSSKHIQKADCIEAARCLSMDGFKMADLSTDTVRRLLRRRERVWLSLFVLERGVCLARGRSYSFPVTPLVKHCDRWHLEAMAIALDGPLISMAVLRRDLDHLFSAVRAKCDDCRTFKNGSDVAEAIETSIDIFFQNWFTTWTAAIGEGDHKSLPPYVEILVTHTRLSTYSSVMNHPTAPLEVKRLFRASALSSALNVMRATIQGESRLQSMPNNTVIMVCFAACIALNLSTPSGGESHNLASSVRNLVEETATILERIGNTPRHRDGTSVMYGRYMHSLAKQVPGQGHEIANQHQPHDLLTQASTDDAKMFAVSADPSQTFAGPQYSTTNLWEPLHFSAMSGNQVTETIMNAGDLDPSFFDLPIDDVTTLGWMDWMNPPDFGF